MPSFRRNARVNRMPDFEAFVSSWDAPQEEDLAPVDLHRTRFGNVNSSGTVGDYSGHALARRHPQFLDSLEPGVRELVRLLADDLGLITYTSCEGHRYPGARVAPTERHVGIAPRDLAEHQSARTLLLRASMRCGPVRVEVVEQTIESDAGTHAVLDVFFRRRRLRTWSAYFRALDGVYEALLQRLRYLMASE